MKQLFAFLIVGFLLFEMAAQTTLTEANDFHVKTIEGETIKLFPLLDNDNKIVVIDFFSTTCGPCQDYADDFQTAYESFGSNEQNVFFVAINYGANNDGVIEFDSIYGVTLPSVSGLQGGGDNVYLDYDIQAYPTVIVITPDHQIVEQHVWPPTSDNIINAVYNAGGIMVGISENIRDEDQVAIFPNPVREKGFIKLNSEEETLFKFEIYDMVGNRLASKKSVFINKGENSIRFDIDELTNGFYFVRYSLGLGNWQTERFVISK